MCGRARLRKYLGEKMSSRQILRSIPGRFYGAQASAKGKPSTERASLAKQDPKLTTLPHGLVVASVENYSPVSHISVLYKAGSRYETGKTIGITHILRNAAGLSTKEATVFGIARSIPQLGASLSCTSTRESINFSIECSRDILDVGVRFLANVSTQPTFKAWEVKDVTLPRVHVDLATLKQNPHVQVLEGLHKAAYRTGLGNSIYCPDWAVGDHSSQMLDTYVKQHFTSSRMAVVGVGVDHANLVEYVNKMFKVEAGPGVESPAAKYSGGEIRVENDSPVVYAAIATEGVSLAKPQDAITLGVLQQIIGIGPQIKRGDSSSTKLGQALAKATKNPHVGSSLNINYTDSGLFGLYIAGQAEDMGKLLKAAVGVYSALTKSGGITEQDVQNGKHKLRACMHLGVEGNGELAEELGIRALVSRQAVVPGEVDSMIDAVTTSDLQALAKKVVNAKPSLSAVGDLTHTPYLDQLLA